MTNAFGYSDEARRASDIINTHIAALGMDATMGKWVAIRLSDGGSDGVLYDERADAVRHQLHETQCAYIKIPPDGCSYKEMTSFLKFNRNIYDAGYRMTDPEREAIRPLISGHNPFGVN